MQESQEVDLSDFSGLSHMNLCLASPMWGPTQGGFSAGNVLLQCQHQRGHEGPSHVSNPYYDVVGRRNMTYVWGVDEEGHAYAYEVDLDALDEGMESWSLHQIVSGYDDWLETS